MPTYPIDASKENGDAQISDHPEHHNDLADAANDHQERLNVVEEALVPHYGGEDHPGATGTVLMKHSNDPYDTRWKAISQVPVPDAGDANKFLKATGAGATTWDDPPEGDPLPNALKTGESGGLGGNGGKWLFNDSGTPKWMKYNDVLATPNEGPAGHVLTSHGTGEQPTWDEPRYVPAYNTGVVDGDVLTYDDLTEELMWKQPPAAGEILGSTVADAGKILAVNGDGDPVWAASPAGVDEFYYLGYSGTAPAYKRPPRTFQSTGDPGSGDGLNGDIWLKYTP